MNRKSPLYFVFLAFLATGLSYFLANGVYHGFPFTWATIKPNLGSQIPIIGFLFLPSVEFSWLGFVVDVAFYFGILWGLYWYATRKR